ncbi:hypothetical protein YC2023_107181 [Brassica napus]
MESFASEDEIGGLRKRMDELLTQFDPSESSSVFSTTNQQHTKDHYFFDSAAKISFFFEALHELDPLYKEFTYSSKVSSLVSSFGRHAVHVHFQDGLVRRFVRGENGVTYDQPSPSYEQKDFVPIEMKPGSIIAIHGDLIHQSFENLSPKSRHAYSLHVVESDGCKWAQDNWIRRENTPEPLYSP